MNYFRYMLSCIAMVSLVGCMDLAQQNLPPKTAKPNAKAARVYTMRGGLGGIFSTGMNELTQTLDKRYNVIAESTIWYKTNKLSNHIIEQRKNQHFTGPIILIGHSLGANEQIKVAENLYRAHVPVDLLITVDAVSPIKIPPNVKYALNIYKPSIVPLFSGLKVRAMDPEFTYVNNLNVAAIPNVAVNHFTIDKNQEVQKIMLLNVLSIVNKNNRVPLKLAREQRLASLAPSRKT